MEAYVSKVVLVYLLISDLIPLIWLKRSEVYTRLKLLLLNCTA